MLEALFNAATAHGLMTGLRVGATVHGEYRLAIWIGPRVGERYEWTRTFPASTPLPDGLGAITREVLGYCEQHDWGGGWAATPADAIAAEAAARWRRLELVGSDG